MNFMMMDIIICEIEREEKTKMKEYNIWSPGVYGIAFEGRKLINEFDYGIKRIDPDSTLLFVGKNEECETARKYLEKYGFYNRYEFCTDTLYKEMISENTAVIFCRNSYYQEWHKLVDSNGACNQLFSVMKTFFSFMRPKMWQVYNMLQDEFSRKVYTISLSVRMHILDNDELAVLFDNNQYFSVPEMHKSLFVKGAFVDCGAFVGDSVEKILNAAEGIIEDKIVAFEPSSRQFKALKCRAERLCKEWALDKNQIECVLGGVGVESGYGFVKEGTQQDHIIANRVETIKSKDAGDIQEEIHIYSLDKYFENHQVSFIKADIEGAEMDMLRGGYRLLPEISHY